MPIYEYSCKKCGAVSEHLVGVVADGAKIVCKSCGSKKLEKMMSSFAMHRGSSKSMPQCDAGSCSSGTCGMTPSSCGGGSCGMS